MEYVIIFVICIVVPAAWVGKHAVAPFSLVPIEHFSLSYGWRCSLSQITARGWCCYCLLTFCTAGCMRIPVHTHIRVVAGYTRKNFG